MSDVSNDDLVPRKKIKYSTHKKEETDCGKETEEKEEEYVLSSSKAELEAGSYFLGPPIKKYMRSPVTVRLGRKKGTDEYFLMKILVLDDSKTSDRGLYMRRTVFHNEYSILSLLKNHEGIIQLYDFFKDYIYKEIDGRKQKLKRVCMAMECLFPHGPYNSDLIPLSNYLKEHKLSETEALHILYNLLSIIKKMHQSNIVHREIKLSNIILNKKTLKVKLMDFYYAKVIASNSEFEPSKPVVSSCLPKSNDVWAAGVVFYAMLCSGCSFGVTKFGSLLSSVRTTQDLYLKLEENKCALLKNASVTLGTKEILCCILCSLPQHRLKASEALDMVSTLLALRSSSHNLSSFADGRNSDQIVPECSEFDCKLISQSERTQASCSINTYGNIQENKTEIKKERIMGGEEEKEEEDECSKIIDKNRIMQPHCSTVVSSKPSEDNEILNRDNIKFAMKRLGATSLNNINALSFNYVNRNSCPS